MRIPLLSVLAFCLLSASASPVWAAKGPQDEARVKGEQGIALFNESKWDEAFASFEEADRLYHAPTLVLFMAHCRRNQGKLLEAEALYERVANEELPAKAPAQFKQAQETARSELSGLKTRIGSLELHLEGPGADKATVNLDGAAISVDALASGKRLNPGDHEIVVESEGAKPEKKAVHLGEGEVRKLSITLHAPPSSPPLRTTEPAPKGSLAPAAIAFATGGVGIGLGTVTGIMAMSKISDIELRCRPDGHCPATDQPEADKAQTLITLSTIGFVAGGVALATGTVLAILRPGGSKTDKDEKKSDTAIQVDVGPGSLFLRGRF